MTTTTSTMMMIMTSPIATMTRLAWALCATHLLIPPATAGSSSSGSSFEEKCLSFKPLSLSPSPSPSHHTAFANATLYRLEYVPAGTDLAFPDNDPSCNRPSQSVGLGGGGGDGLCRIALEVPTSLRSAFQFELWLPEIWNGRTLATGNGGLDGCIKYEDIAYGAANGFSSMCRHIPPRSFGTNNGHNGTSGAAFYHNEDVVIDFSWRALHTSVEIGKQLTSLFYGTETGKSYYIGCSLGGRQGIGNAEKFPGDFDGIVAGAPAVDFNSLYSWRASFFPATGDAASPGFIPAETWKTTIHDEVLRQCDLIDAVEDGIIEDPILCHVDLTKLLCGGDGGGEEDDKGNSAANCLSAAQMETAKAIYDDYLWPDGTLLYPRVNPGGEILAADGLYSGKAYGPSADWFKYAVLGDPSWDPATYTLDDARVAVAADPADIATWPSRASLGPFRGRGGKILSYHGQQDQQISSLNSVRFWKHLASGADDDDGPDETDAFFRLFRIPGMNHCGGGPGAWTVGQGGAAVSYGIPFDAAHNVLAAVVDWVEKGDAPVEIVGTKFVDDSVEAGVAYRHRHCRYPYRSTYSGDGDPLDEESWHCVNFGGY